MISFEYVDNTLLCKFPNRMDSVNSSSVEEAIKNRIFELQLIHPTEFRMINNDGKKRYESLSIDFDLEKTNFVSSAFLRVCLIYAKQIQKGNFRVVNTSLMIKKTFKIAGLDKYFEVL